MSSGILGKVQRGVLSRPQKVVIYGPEAVGKTTLAAQAPNPLFLDTEGGTAQIDVPRIEVGSWEEITAAIAELKRDRAGFESLILDTVDWAEKLATDFVVQRANKASIKGIEDFGYGKGFTILAEEITRMLLALEALPMHKLLIAHSKVVRFEPPDAGTGWDRYELKLTKTVMPLVKEWSDALLFCQWDQRTKETESGRVKGVGGKERYIYTTHCAAFDAKHRHGLAERLPMEWASIAPLFSARVESTKQEPPPTHAANDFAALVAGKESQVITFLVLRGTLKGGQGIADVPADYAARVLARPKEFLAAVEANVTEGK